jgi:hypothetical protein
MAADIAGTSGNEHAGLVHLSSFHGEPECGKERWTGRPSAHTIRALDEEVPE